MSQLFTRSTGTETDRPVFSRENAERSYADLSWLAETEPLLDRERRQERRTDRVNRFFKTAILILLGILVLEIVFNFFVEPRMVITSVRISSDGRLPLSDAEILEKAGLQGTLSYLDIDVRKAEESLRRIPLVRNAAVEKHFPNLMEIRLESRVPLGVVLAEQEGLTVPLVFDEQGVIFSIGDSPLLTDLPVVSGIRFPELRPGVRLPDPLISFLGDLSVMKENSGTLFGLISELKFVKKNTNDYEVLLFPRQYRTRVRIGSRIDESLMKNILMVLDMVARENLAPSLEELDFRGSKIVYRTREE